LIEHGGYVPTDDGLLRLTLGEEAQEVVKKRKKELVQGPDGKVLMIESSSNSLTDDESKEKTGLLEEGSGKQALIKVDKGKGRAQEDVDDEEEVMALVLSGANDDNARSADSVALIRPAPSLNAPDISDQQLVIPNALPLAQTLQSDSPQDKDALTELPLPADSHLARALNEAGLPETAMMNQDGQLVPARDLANGSGDGLGRGEMERKKRELIEKAVMADEKDSRERTVPTWAYRVSVATRGLGSSSG
jgi:hypothetical protein